MASSTKFKKLVTKLNEFNLFSCLALALFLGIVSLTFELNTLLLKFSVYNIKLI